jgi:DNA gyrase subunit A
MLAIANQRPETLSLKGILKNYLEFQYENNTRKYNELLEKELERKEIREGLIKACDVIDLIIAILRGSRNLKDAKACLTAGDTSKITFKHPELEADAKELRFTEKQATAILEMRLYKLIGLEILALKKEYNECLKKIAEYQKILKSRSNMNKVIKEDLDQIKAEFAVPRKTVIEDSREAVYEETPVQAQDAVFVMDRFGYCKLLDETTYERNRETIESDCRYAIPCTTDDRLLIFTDTGCMHQLKTKDVPFGKIRDKGTPIDNITKYEGAKEEILFMTKTSAIQGQFLLFATKQGMVKQVPAEEFATNNRTVAATKLQEGDAVAAVRVIGQETELVLQTSADMFLRFSMDEIPEMKKSAKGVRGIKLGDKDVLEEVYFVNQQQMVNYKGKDVYLNKLKVAKRDTKGTKVRL